MADQGGGDIVIKKVKKGGHGHHGGAWKVAYADFVTAMMAFFLLLWLLSSVPSEKLKGISEYFTPTTGLKDQMGIGFEGGATVSQDGKERDEFTNDAIMFAASPANSSMEAPPTVIEEQLEVESENFSRLEHDLYKAIHEHQEVKKFEKNIKIDQTPEGLRIQILDDKKRSMFIGGTAELQPYMKQILERVGRIIKYLPNYISITGHTSPDGFQQKAKKKKYGNWELSADRANSTRRYLEEVHIDGEQIAKVVGRADTQPLDPEKPDAPFNKRISIVLLKDALMPKEKLAVPPDLLGKDKKKKR